MKTRDYWKGNLWKLLKLDVLLKIHIYIYIIFFKLTGKVLRDYVGVISFQRESKGTKIINLIFMKRRNIYRKSVQVCSIFGRHFRFNAYSSHNTRVDFNWHSDTSFLVFPFCLPSMHTVIIFFKLWSGASHVSSVLIYIGKVIGVQTPQSKVLSTNLVDFSFLLASSLKAILNNTS